MKCAGCGKYKGALTYNSRLDKYFCKSCKKLEPNRKRNIRKRYK